VRIPRRSTHLDAQNSLPPTRTYLPTYLPYQLTHLCPRTVVQVGYPHLLPCGTSHAPRPGVIGLACPPCHVVDVSRHTRRRPRRVRHKRRRTGCDEGSRCVSTFSAGETREQRAVSRRGCRLVGGRGPQIPRPMLSPSEVLVRRRGGRRSLAPCPSLLLESFFFSGGRDGLFRLVFVLVVQLQMCTPTSGYLPGSPGSPG